MIETIKSLRKAKPVVVETAPAAMPAVKPWRPVQSAVVARLPIPTEDGQGPLEFVPEAADHLPAPAMALSERNCLARAIYFEARGESIEGQIAVAQVVLNRVRSPRWPNSVCEVVYQGVERGERCQFSFACYDRNKALDASPLWLQAQWVADEVAAGRAFLSELSEAGYYHTTRVRPVWRLGLRQVARIGNHIFYADPAIAREPGEAAAALNGYEPAADHLPPALDLAAHRAAVAAHEAPVVLPRLTPADVAATKPKPAPAPVKRAEAKPQQAAPSSAGIWERMQAR